jgi:hypothetical protein
MTRIDAVWATVTELFNAFGGGRGEDSQHERPPAVVAAFLGPRHRDVIGHCRTLEPQAQPTRRLSSRGTTSDASGDPGPSRTIFDAVEPPCRFWN